VGADWCVQAGHLHTQRTHERTNERTNERTSFLGSEGEQADDLSTGSTPTGNVLQGVFAFLVSRGEGPVDCSKSIARPHNGKSMCVCV